MTYSRARSQALLERAKNSLAGGVGSGVRLAEQPGPLYFERGVGPRIYDVDGNEYIDYVLGQGPLLLGHSPQPVIDAVREQVGQLLISAGEHVVEIELSERLQRSLPVAGLVRYNGSGSEAVASALRIARAATGREKYIKFEGHYHGWPDPVIISYWPDPAQAGPREHPRAIPGSGGMVGHVLEEVIVLPWNDLAVVEATLREWGHEVAALITEPIMVNSGGIAPGPGYLEGLRRLTEQYGVVLIFDEVITGFRVALGGAQELYGVTPDLATYAKGIAAGLPLAAVAGKRELMDLIVNGSVLHGGTYNTHPLVMAGANAAVAYLERERDTVYPRLFAMGDRLRDGLRAICGRRGVPCVASGVGPAVQLTFTDRPAIVDYRDYAARDQALYQKFVAQLAVRGVRTILRGTWYISAAHTADDIDATLAAADAALAAALG